MGTSFSISEIHTKEKNSECKCRKACGQNVCLAHHQCPHLESHPQSFLSHPHATKPCSFQSTVYHCSVRHNYAICVSVML